MKALVLCAGFGTRLGELTKSMPKALLDIEGQPLLARTVQYLKANGVSEVAINAHYKAEQLREFAQRYTSPELPIKYVYEPSTLGTAGSVRNLAAYFRGAQEFLVLYGDLLLDQPLEAMIEQHRKTQADATILVHARTKSNSIVTVNDEMRIVELRERPEQNAVSDRPYLVNSGLYILGPRALAVIERPAMYDFPRDVFPAMIAEKMNIYAFKLTSYRCAIDSPERLNEARAAVRELRYAFHAT